MIPSHLLLLPGNLGGKLQMIFSRIRNSGKFYLHVGLIECNSSIAFCITRRMKVYSNESCNHLNTKLSRQVNICIPCPSCVVIMVLGYIYEEIICAGFGNKISIFYILQLQLCLRLYISKNCDTPEHIFAFALSQNIL